MHPDIDALLDRDTESVTTWLPAGLSMSAYTPPELIRLVVSRNLSTVLPSFEGQLESHNMDYFRDLISLRLWEPVRKAILDALADNEFAVWDLPLRPEERETYVPKAAENILVTYREDTPKLLEKIRAIPPLLSTLCQALQYRCPREVIEWLLQQGLPINEPYGMVGTPLMWACRGECSKEILQLLLDKCADPTFVHRGRSVMSWCEDTPAGHAALECVYTDQPQLDAELRQAIRGRAYRDFNSNRIRLLVRLGADVDLNMETSPDEHITPLMYACHNGRVLLIRLLLELGADKNLRAVKDDPDSRAYTFYLNYLSRGRRQDFDTLELLE